MSGENIEFNLLPKRYEKSCVLINLFKEKYHCNLVIDSFNDMIDNEIDLIPEDPDRKARESVKKGSFFVFGQMKKINHPLIELLKTAIRYSNENYFGYNIYPWFEEYFLNLNVYSKDSGEYDWHIDGDGRNMVVDFKLTSIMNISDNNDYEGGQFELLNVDEFDLKKGELIIFDSHHAHRVKPITKGIRKTLSFWVKGPKWR